MKKMFTTAAVAAIASLGASAQAAPEFVYDFVPEITAELVQDVTNQETGQLESQVMIQVRYDEEVWWVAGVSQYCYILDSNGEVYENWTRDFSGPSSDYNAFYYGINGISKYEDADYTLVVPQGIFGNTNWYYDYDGGRSNPELRYEFNAWKLAGCPREDKTVYDFDPISASSSVEEVRINGQKKLELQLKLDFSEPVALYNQLNNKWGVSKQTGDEEWERLSDNCLRAWVAEDNPNQVIVGLSGEGVDLKNSVNYDLSIWSGSFGTLEWAAEDFYEGRANSPLYYTLNPTCDPIVGGGTSSETLPAPDPDQVIVDDEPEGTEVLYSRTCEALREMYGEVERIIEEGSIVSYIQQEDGTVWLGNAVSMYRLPGWVKATKDGDYLTIQGPQLVYQEPDYDSDDWDAMINYYLTAVEEYEYVNEEGETMRSYRATPDGTFRFKIDGNTLKQDGDGSLILGVCGYNDADGYYFTGYGDRYDVLTVPELKPVELPANAEVKKGWAMTYSDVDDLENGRLIDVAINGDDYYVKGMYEGLPEAWVKGSKKDDTIVFDNYQMVGPDFNWGYFVYLAGGQMVALDDDYYLDDATIEEGGYTMTVNEDGSWDADNDVIFITSPQTNPENANYLAAYIGMNIKEQDLSTLTNPVGPDEGFFGGFDGVPAVEFNLPPLDENGNLLDKNNLYFRVFVNDSNEPYTFDPETYWYDLPEMDIWEPVTELPYDIPDNGFDMYQAGAWHTVYIYSDEAVSSLGVQAVYYPEGREENPENVLYSVIAVFDDPNSVDSIISGKEVKNVTFFNLMGQKEANPSAGVYIKRIEFADGTVKTLKVTRR